MWRERLRVFDLELQAGCGEACVSDMSGILSLKRSRERKREMEDYAWLSPPRRHI